MTITQSILNQMYIYCASLKTLKFCGLFEKYSTQVDLIIDNLYMSSQMLRMEACRELREVQMSVNVKV